MTKDPQVLKCSSIKQFKRVLSEQPEIVHELGGMFLRLFGKVEVLKVLIEAGVDINDVDFDWETALHIAAKDGDIPKAKLLIDSGADINATNIHGYTPLMASVESGSYKMTKFLLEQKADPNISETLRRPALYFALTDKSIELLKLLIAHGGRTNGTTLKGVDVWKWLKKRAA